MKDQEKRELASWVKRYIELGYSKTKTIEKVHQLGFKKRTIGVYYKVFSLAPISK